MAADVCFDVIDRLPQLRGRALECMGHVAIAVGKENFKPYVEPCIV